MNACFRSCCIGAALVAVSSSSFHRAVAQVVISADGMMVNGVDLRPYGGASSITVESYYSTPGFVSGVVRPYPVVGWGGLPYSSPFGGYGGYFSSWYGNPWYPPVVVPAEWFYGLSASHPLTGSGQWSNSSSVRQTTVVLPASPQPVPKTGNGFGANAPANPSQIPPPPMNLAQTNSATQARARKIVDSGDVLFQQQQFADALAKYKDAARAAPDLAHAYFRQAAADVALGRYEDAVSAIKLGLRLQSTWVDSQFRFAALYGPAELTRRQHFNALEQAVNDRPTSDLLFLYGVLNFFDDAPQQAEPLLARAAALAIGETWHILLFQKALQRQFPVAAPAEQPAVVGARDI